VDAEVKAGLLALAEYAVDVSGWSLARAAGMLGLDPVRAARWFARREVGQLADGRAGAAPLHALLPAERDAIIAVYEAWVDIDRSHRKLAHRGSRLGVVHVCESSVLRVLTAEGLVLHGNPAREPVPRAPWPAWLEWKPNRIWAWDFTHFTRAKRAAVAILDVVSRKWITTLVCAEETSTQVEVVFTNALRAEGLLELGDALATDALRAALRSGQPDALADLVAAGQVLGDTASGNGSATGAYVQRIDVVDIS
jgi:putative transposase